jgi:hypothetical protein
MSPSATTPLRPRCRPGGRSIAVDDAGRRRADAEKDDVIDPLGVKGGGEIGIVGTAAAVANAVFHATGKRVRDLPITIDKLMA